MGAAAIVLAAGAAVAIAKPGDLGEDDASAPTENTTTSTAPDSGTSTTGTTEGTTVTTVDGSGETTTTLAGETTTTTGGSGIGSTDNGSVGTGDGVADTGMESLLGPGLGLAALGLALRRLVNRRPA